MPSKRTPKVAVIGACSLFFATLAALVAPAGVAQVTAAGRPYAAPAVHRSVNTRTLNTLSFLHAETYETGGQFAASVAVGDLNGDGNPDLVVTNIYGKTGLPPSVVGVLLNNGDGTFQPVVAYDSRGGWAGSVALADVNGDGKIDSVVTNETGSASCPNGAVDILVGNGDGTFRPAVEYCSGGSTPLSVAFADVNDDGKPDLVVANAGSNNVGVLIGNGDGTFLHAVSYGSGWPGPIHVVVADVNGDRRPDLVTADFNTIPSSVSVLLGNGNGTFQPAVISASGGYYAIWVAIADVNGDGFPDLLVANERACTHCQNGSLDVLLGNGDGTFQTAVGYSSGGNGAMSLAVADVNGDGKLDLVAANYESDNLGVLLGNGDGTLQPAVTYPSGGNGPISVAIADVNRDAKPDLLAVNWYGNGNDAGLVALLLNNIAFCTAPPIITFSATPTFLWPPNGKTVPVTVSGTITDTGCAVTAAAYAVTDEYGKMQPSGPVTLNSVGSYSFTVLLDASRRGTDIDGRVYTVTVRARNNAGETGSEAGMVIVPHDHGH
jgi:hypothetical protein